MRQLVALTVGSVLCVLAITSLSWDARFLSFATSPNNEATATFHIPAQNANPDAKMTLPEFNVSLLLNGPPTPSFRENLRPQSDVSYVTSWPTFGFTNQVIADMNLIYLGLLTERVPIIPRFVPAPEHMPPSSPEVDFGDVFDIPRLQHEIDMPILEWHQVKEHNSQFIDVLGCWGVRNVVFSTDGFELSPPENLKIDVSFTSPPDWVHELNDPQYPHILFWPLASLAFSDRRTGSPQSSPAQGASLTADDGRLLCYDSLYFVGAPKGIEKFTEEIPPAWRFVGQHMHWNPKLERLAKIYLRIALGITPRAPIPPYIAVHARRTDFKIWCEGVPEEDCYVELPAISRRVDEVKAEILAKKGVQVAHVIITSDEPDPSWWEEVRKLGWRWLDHSEARTEQLYGPWHPIFIDAIIHSSAVGFVGTQVSTVSLLSARRVRSWNHGVTKMVVWGKPGADDHRRKAPRNQSL
ncbi:hypothetical protein K438DRAFT_1673147 [Mycena galopus ATCC 62051]|nr:hypothetical protein K438DRAFT_1673147 [Mycena galopus ATCC 62051]